MGDLVAGLSAGKPVDCTDGLQRRDFLHTADLGRALATLALQRAAGAVNIASGEAVAVRDIIHELERQLGCEGLAQLGAIERPADDPECIAADTARLRKEFGFRPTFDLEAGLADVVRLDVTRA